MPYPRSLKKFPSENCGARIRAMHQEIHPKKLLLSRVQPDTVMMETGQISAASCAQASCSPGISPVARSPPLRYCSTILLNPSFGSSSKTAGQVLQHVVQLVHSARLIVTDGISHFTSRDYLYMTISSLPAYSFFWGGDFLFSPLKNPLTWPQFSSGKFIQGENILLPYMMAIE